MLCVTCPNRDSGLCGTLLEAQARNAGSNQTSRSPQLQVARPGERITARDDATPQIFVLCAGWAYRFIELGDGRRQILGFLLPGDLFSVISIFDPQSQFSVTALTDVQVSRFERPREAVRAAMSDRFLRSMESAYKSEHDGAIELMMVLGKFSAEERIAYLLHHLAQRLKARSVIRDQNYPFPLRLRHIADTLGLTPVHVSRVLGHFRHRRLCVLSNGVLNVLDPKELERLGTIA